MRTLRRFLKRLSAWTTTERDEERLRAEIEEHLAMQIEENLRAGFSPADARRKALVKFGAIEPVRESYREARGLPFLDHLVQNGRYALRRLRKAPAFTITTILTLALGIGATTAIFTLAHAVLLKSLPVAKPGELYRIGRKTHCCVWGGYTQYEEFSVFSYDLYKYLRDNTSGFSEMAAFQAGGGGLFGFRRSGSAEPAEMRLGELVSGNYFSMFGLKGFAGRMLAPRDDRPGAQPVAVMSYRLWQQKYQGDASILGAVFNVNQKPFTIIGITPPGFFGDTLTPTSPDFYLPMAAEPVVEGSNSLLNRASLHWLDIIGRIRPGFPPATLESQLRVALKQWMLSHWADMTANARAYFPKETLYLSPGGAGITSMREQYEHWLKILMMVSGFVLLIVCANVASLLLVRGMEMRRQISLSMALGARGSHLVGQALTESVLLSLIGGAAGLAVSFAGARLIRDLTFPRWTVFPGFAGVPIDASPSLPVLLFAFVISLITGLAFGILPAWTATSADPIEALRGVNRATARSGAFPRRLLVIFQAALSLVLLSASGLLTATLHNLENQDFGFERDRRTIVNIDPQFADYRPEQLDDLYRRIQIVFSGIPGVESVAISNQSPLSDNNWNDGIYVNGRPAPGPNDDNSASFDRVTAGYLEATGDPILKGRSISRQDTQAAPHVAVVNEAFVHRFFPHEDPIGKHFGRQLGATRQYEIVGVAKNARYMTYNLDQPIGPMLFLPEAQYDVFPTPGDTHGDLRTHFLHDMVVVTRPGVRLPESAIYRAMAAVDPNLPVNYIRPLRDQVAAQFSQQRLIARLTSLFGIVSLLLACIGLYGVTAYTAGRRTNEIGVRMALGADRGSVIGLVLRGALGLIVVGLLAGLPLSASAGHVLGDLLYGTNPNNPVVIGFAVAALGVSAFIAAMIPALRASYISPIDALRME